MTEEQTTIDEQREVVRCHRCNLNQFMTRNGKCRRCRVSLSAAPPLIGPQLENLSIEELVALKAAEQVKKPRARRGLDAKSEAAVKRALEDPHMVWKRRSDAMKKSWADPEKRQRRMIALCSPEARRRKAEGVRKAWAKLKAEGIVMRRRGRGVKTKELS
jgi:hypothetical protein